jgi:hypothetical protein
MGRDKGFGRGSIPAWPGSSQQAADLVAKLAGLGRIEIARYGRRAHSFHGNPFFQYMKMGAVRGI